jgi:hypothetical protein
VLKRWFAPLALALFLAACGTPAVVTLNVTALNPADDATDVAIDVVLSATFDRAIDAATLAGAFTLAADGGADVAGVAALSPDGLTATFTPAADLAYATTYTATVAGTVATTDGVELGGEASWSFTTVDEPLPDALVGGDYTTTVVVEGDAVDLAADVTGGEGAYAFALTTGALPTGVTLDATTGAIAGVPTETGLFEGTVTVTDDAAQTAVLDFSIEVAEVLVGGAYAAYDAPSNVATEIDLASPFTGGYGTISYAVTAGALPAAFTTLDLDPLVVGDYPDYAGGATYEVALDAATGAIGGFTGAVGTFTGTVTATDDLGQTATATFELVLGFDLAYVGGTDFLVGFEGDVVVVNGDKVRVSGVPTDALPASFPVLFYDLVFDDVASTGDVEPTDFTINEGEGAITKIYENGIGASLWVYDVTVQAGVVVNEGTIDEGIEADPTSTPSAPVTFTFEYLGGPI